MSWQTDTSENAVSADIISVRVECLPSGSKRYQIAATANVMPAVHNIVVYEQATKSGGSVELPIRFKAQSNSGVVLASVDGRFRVVRGQFSSDVSATITGLSEEEIRRVAKVTAGWVYTQ